MKTILLSLLVTIFSITSFAQEKIHLNSPSQNSEDFEKEQDEKSDYPPYIVAGQTTGDGVYHKVLIPNFSGSSNSTKTLDLNNDNIDDLEFKASFSAQWFELSSGVAIRGINGAELCVCYDSIDDIDTIPYGDTINSNSQWQSELLTFYGLYYFENNDPIISGVWYNVEAGHYAMGVKLIVDSDTAYAWVGITNESNYTVYEFAVSGNVYLPGHDVNITIHDDSEPIVGAKLVVSDFETKISDSDGFINLDEYIPRVYDYYVSHAEYDTLFGSFEVVDEPLNIDLEMEDIVTDYDNFIIAGAQSGNKLVYTDIEDIYYTLYLDSITSYINATTIYLDLNKDSVNDISIYTYYSYDYNSGYEKVVFTPLNGAQLSRRGDNYLDTIAYGDTINYTSNWSSDRLTCEEYFFYYPSGHNSLGYWPHSVELGTYAIGIRFINDHNACYGWLGMSRKYTARIYNYFTICDYALQDPNYSVNENDRKNLKIYPNPVRDYFIIENVRGEYIELYDINGRKLISEYADSDKYKFSVQGLTSGIYFVKCDEACSKIVIDR